MPLFYNGKLKPFSSQLRLEATECERQLWSHLRRKQILGIQFYRQKIIGNYIVDFYAPAVQLVIEVDGSQHAEPEYKEADAIRDAYLKELALNVLRFDNYQVGKSLDEVLEVIYAHVKAYLR